WTLRPSMSNTLSIMPDAFSNDIEYEKPEQPPPTTPTRSPAGTGFCWVMISLTLATAFAVKVMGAVFALVSGCTSGMDVVAIRYLLEKRTQIIIAKPAKEAGKNQPQFVNPGSVNKTLMIRSPFRTQTRNKNA